MKKAKQPLRPAKAEEVRIEIPISAPRKAVWKALVSDTGAWWPKDFHTSARTKAFVIEPKLGGRAFEDAGNGEGLIWYTVLGVEAPDFLLMSGYVVPPYGGPSTSLLRLTLTDSKDGGTSLEVLDASFGVVGDCDKEAGWRQIFSDGLKAFVERKK